MLTKLCIESYVRERVSAGLDSLVEEGVIKDYEVDHVAAAIIERPPQDLSEYLLMELFGWKPWQAVARATAVACPPMHTFDIKVQLTGDTEHDEH